MTMAVSGGVNAAPNGLFFGLQSNSVRTRYLFVPTPDRYPLEYLFVPTPDRHPLE